MAAPRLEIMDIRQLLQLKIRGLSNRSVAELTGIHRNSVNTYVRLLSNCGQSYEDLLLLSGVKLSELFPSIGTLDKDRYEVLSSYFGYFRKELKKPGCTRQVLWKEYLLKHPDGYGLSQFNEHIKRWLKQVKSSGKLDHKAGDKVYVDYTGKKLSYIDRSTGEVIEVEVFVGILPCSGYTFVEASPSQKLEDFICSMNNCLRYFGGVPKAIVPDNLKSAVTKGSKYEPTLNKTFKDMALHYGCAINPARTYSPKDKALVEGAVKLVYQRIFYPLSKMEFFSLADINLQIRQLNEQYNAYLLSRINLSRKQQFTDIEQAFLASLPAEDYTLRFYRRATVQKMGYIYLSCDKNYYSVPYRYIGRKVEVSYNQHSVEVYYGQQRIASHKRIFRSGYYTTIKDHLSSSHQFYKDWSPDFFHNLAKPHGSAVVDYIKGLIQQAQYPEIAYKQCLGILSLARTHPKRINIACQKSLDFNRLGYNIIKNILKHKMDLEPEPLPVSNTIIPHENIRGANYYQ